jgi:hypothetical protein
MFGEPQNQFPLTRAALSTGGRAKGNFRSSGTLVDTSLEPKLGKRLGTTTMHSWGTSRERPVYAAPRLYLGGVQLITEDHVASDDCKWMPSDSGQPIMGMLSIDCLRHYCIQPTPTSCWGTGDTSWA